MHEPAANSTGTVPHPPPPFKVAAFYRFAAHTDVLSWQEPLARFCGAAGIRGTILLAPEGINGTVAGTPTAVAALMAYLGDDPLFAGTFAGAEIKYAAAQEQPFHRMKVRRKREIVTLRAPEADPRRQVGTYVDPEAWNELIAAGDVTLIDTRNRYEVALGSFAGALDPGTGSFAEFTAFVDTHLDPARNRKVAMFCTGGIRCEKASSYLLAHGFEEVFHLKGGILAYLERVPPTHSRWHGECFVFDERVAVGHGLGAGTASLCRACRMPLSAADRQRPEYLAGRRCHHCAGDESRSLGAAERQRQVELAAARGVAHLGDDATRAADRNRVAKAARRQSPPKPSN